MHMEGISHIVIEVSDLKRAAEFYRQVLGFELVEDDGAADRGASVVLRAASGQSLILSESVEPRSLPETGVHQAYRVAPRHREAIGRNLAARQIDVYAYKEDRRAEEADNFYFYDFDGNRVQLVVSAADSHPDGKVLAIDHTAVECHDLEWAEDFYVNILGLPVDQRIGWRTADYVRAQLWGEGKEEMAPGTRRWDQRYTVMEQKRRIPRPNTHFFLRVGDGVLGIYLATQHRQEPPEEQIVGAPRIALRASRGTLDEILKLLKERRFPVYGPVEHPASSPIATSVYVRDPGANFLELCAPKESRESRIEDRR
jgi:catechol 2,3-dioxygenase-like lactoylglutathione lyase family enzyme